MTFELGDKVIYPNHGLGIVERIEEKTILGTTCGFYHLRIVANETTVLVPVSNVDGVGLRRAISDEEVERLFELLGDGNIDNHQNWKGRFKDNSDKMRSGSIYDVADVLKSLTFLAKSKSLSFREKRMLDRAKFLIISEVSEVVRQTQGAIEGRVDTALELCFTTRAKVGPRPPIPRPAPAPPRPPVLAPVVAAARPVLAPSVAAPVRPTPPPAPPAPVPARVVAPVRPVAKAVAKSAAPKPAAPARKVTPAAKAAAKSPARPKAAVKAKAAPKAKAPVKAKAKAPAKAKAAVKAKAPAKAPIKAKAPVKAKAKVKTKAVARRA